MMINLLIYIIVAVSTFIILVKVRPYDNGSKPELKPKSERKCAVCGKPTETIGVHKHCLNKSINRPLNGLNK